ncbi:hypothetical protein OnM2_091045, partial [Erysiphe neolycopersici]
MAILEDNHSRAYMSKVLLDTLKDFDITYNIKSITRDNASSNNTLISSFIRDYDSDAIKFQGDRYSLLRSSEDSIEELDATRAIEDDEDELEERNIFI